MAATEPVYISYLNYVGSGAPADGDQITSDNSQYPLNTVYTDRETGTRYVRKATTKVAATDWQADGSTSNITYDSVSDIVFTTTGTTFNIVADGVDKGTWDRILQPDSGAEGWVFSVSDTVLRFSLGSYSAEVLLATSVTVDGIVKVLGLRGLYAFLRDQVFFLPSTGSDKIYRSLLFQTGTNNPVAVTKGNTLSGTPVWTRVGIGTYKGTLVGAFPANKTICPPFGGAYAMIPLSSNSIADYYYQVVVEDGDEDNVYVYVYDSSYAHAELSAVVSSNSVYVEVIVIP